MSDPRYPIGKFEGKDSYNDQEIESSLRTIESFPARFAKAVEALTPSLLDAPYRDGGWTRRQVIHHVADSHTNAYIRTKWTLTENNPLIKAYEEKEWAQTPEMTADPALSIALLKALHAKWIILLRKLQPSDLKRTFIHPETKATVTLERMLALYAWHGDHHLGHINIR